MTLNTYPAWLCWLGFVYLIRLFIITVYEIIFAIKVHIIPRLYPTSDLTKYGEWAVILGAEDKMLSYYAEELAGKGLKLILVSRSLNKIADIAKNIEDKHKTVVECLSVDFRQEKEIHNVFAKKVEGIDIGVLVCGVDNRRKHIGKFLEATPEELWGTIDNNMTSIVMAMSFILPGMVKRGRGKVINITSLFAMGPQPNKTAQESATKAFSFFLSRASQFELDSNGVEVQTLLPATVLSDPDHPFLFNYPSAKDYAHSAICLIDRCNMTTGHWLHGTFQFLKHNLPRTLWKIIEEAGTYQLKMK